MKSSFKVLTIIQIILIVVCSTPLNLNGNSTIIKSETSIPNYFLEESISESSTEYSLMSNDEWNRVDDSVVCNNFEYSGNQNETIDEFSIEDCGNWSLTNEFNFKNIRSEKIVNGDAETSENLWTEYIPSHYEGNITREDNPSNGEVISGNNSWYFDIQTNNYTTIAGFDDPISLNGDSTFFSFSYSLQRNNLGTNYDSNICIRLFFQFDIYIFIWFNGNIGVLSNVTGPGGYADLLVNNANFDGVTHEYSLNITKLGLDLFNQKPDQLRSFAVQTWGELPYQMEFIFDDISLTDLKDPTNIDLKVNSNQVIGVLGNGNVSFIENPLNSINYQVTYTSTEEILWDLDYTINGITEYKTIRYCEFIDWNNIRWLENITINNIPSLVNESKICKWIPNDWTIETIEIDTQLTSHNIILTNSTHNMIEILIPQNANFARIKYTANNKINNLVLDDYEVSHDDNLSISLDSDIVGDDIVLYIFDSSNQIIYTYMNNSNVLGFATFNNLELNNRLSRGEYKVVAFWYKSDCSGVGEKTFTINTIPTDIILTNNNLNVNYMQNFDIEIDYINLETNNSINLATVTYNWDFSQGILDQNLMMRYSTTINNNQANTGTYNIEVLCFKNTFASVKSYITIHIIFDNILMNLNTPIESIPGGTIDVNSIVLDNNSNPIENVQIRYFVNNVQHLDTWTNSSGYASMIYYISPIYTYNSLNISCSVIIDDSVYLTQNASIIIDLFKTPKIVSANLLEQSNFGRDSSSFFFELIYPSNGLNWFFNIPVGFAPINAILITDLGNITAEVSPFGYVLWEREVTNYQQIDDILELEIPNPESEVVVNNVDKNHISIEVNINTNHIPLNGYEVKINQTSELQVFESWNLYLNDTIVNIENDLTVTENHILFKIFSTDKMSNLTFYLEGTKLSLVQISPSTIILGVGIVVLTTTSIILLRKKKSNVSLDLNI